MTASRWLWYSSVPGMAVPGMACPGMCGTGSYPLYIYLGQVPGLYWDYVDTTTQEILSAFPGLWYTMYAVSNRAGLTVPPPDARWRSSAAGFTPQVVFFPHIALAQARAVNVALQAHLAAMPPAPQPQGTPEQARVPERPPPSEYALALAAGRALNAARQGRGETVGS
jgi:hypothetical protein